MRNVGCHRPMLPGGAPSIVRSEDRTNGSRTGCSLPLTSLVAGGRIVLDPKASEWTFWDVTCLVHRRVHFR